MNFLSVHLELFRVHINCVRTAAGFNHFNYRIHCAKKLGTYGWTAMARNMGVAWFRRKGRRREDKVEKTAYRTMLRRQWKDKLDSSVLSSKCNRRDMEHRVRSARKPTQAWVCLVQKHRALNPLITSKSLSWENLELIRGFNSVQSVKAKMYFLLYTLYFMQYTF
jgi:hypothetical protein